MTDDLIDRLAQSNPLPEELPPLPIKQILRELDELPAPPPARPVRKLLGRALDPLPIALSLLILAAVLAVLITGGPSGRAGRTTPTPTADNALQRLAASQFAVFARPQTARDRALPAIVHRAAKLGGLGPGADSALYGVLPSLTRYTQTISGGREVFLAVIRPQAWPRPLARRRGGLRSGVPRARPMLIIKVLIIQPDGRWTDGQPLIAPGGSETAGDAYLEARSGRQGCALDTYWEIVPNKVARVRWQFGRQDPLGYVYWAPLTVNMAVHGNVAVATIPQRASCDSPTTVTLYGRQGQVLSRTGDPAALKRITRPVRHGSPFGYKLLQHRAERDAHRH